jgi:cell division protein FtsA
VAKRGETVCAVDFGSRQVRVLIARKGDDGVIQIIGHGVVPSHGCVSQGVIQDVGAAQGALKRALSAAEKEAGVKAHELFCGVNGKNVETYIREGNVKLDKEIVELRHLNDALDIASRDILAPGKHVVSSVTSQEWYVDDMRVSDPIGIRGGVLKARVHFAQLPSVIVDNLRLCVESQGRVLKDVVFMPIAAGLGCLKLDDYDLGVAVLDMGQATTGVAVYRDRRILATHSFDWGGFYITRDVAAGLHISFEEALELVVEYGVAKRLIDADFGGVKASDPEDTQHGTDHGPTIKLKSAVRGAPSIVERGELEIITYERCKQLMTKVRQFLHARGLEKHLVRGIVLTGGVAALRNQSELAKAVFETTCTVGMPERIDLLPQVINSPAYAPSIGVIRHGIEYNAAARSGRVAARQGKIGSALGGMVEFLQKYFF